MNVIKKLKKEAEKQKKEISKPQLTDYQLKLKDTRWQRKRIKILNRDDCYCVVCGEETNLQVHHIAYNGEPWDVDDRFLVTLCKDCHEHEELALKNLGSDLLTRFRKLGFMANDIEHLLITLSCYENWRQNDVVLSMIKELLTDDVIYQLVQNYMVGKMALKNRRNECPF